MTQNDVVEFNGGIFSVGIRIADDHRMAPREFRRILEREADLKVVAKRKTDWKPWPWPKNSGPPSF